MLTWKKHPTAIKGDGRPDDTSDFFLGDDDHDEDGSVLFRTPIGHLRPVEPRHSVWVGCATVDVTRTHLARIARVKGVDALRPLSRYTFILGVAPNFDAERAKRAVERIVEPPAGYKQLRILKSGLQDRYPFWAVVRTAAGLLRPVSADTRAGLNKLTAAIDGKVVARG